MMMGSWGRQSAAPGKHDRVGPAYLHLTQARTKKRQRHPARSAQPVSSSVQYRDGALEGERWDIATTILREGLNPLSILNGGERFVVAEVDGRLAGFGQVRPLGSGDQTMELASMVVREAYR